MQNLAEPVCADGDTVREILGALQERIGPQKYSAWFRHGTQLTVEDTCVKVSVPNPFVANWIETHYQPEIAAVAEAQTGRKRPVVVTIDPALNGTLRQRQLDTQAEIVSRATHGRGRERTPLRPITLRHELSDFVVGASNKLAYSTASAMTSGEKPPFNPLFIHGSCGVGKTHLLQGVCNAARRLRRDGRAIRWRYVTGEQFTNEYIAAVRKKTYEQFRSRYRNLDLLAIDDVHFLAAKKATQDEFLHTFNAIESAGKRVVMASDAHPRMVGDLNEQLISRFVAGMVVRIESPDQATRLKILRRRAERMKLQCSPEVLEYIAMHVRGSVRELEGALIKLAALSAIQGGAVSLELATQAMADHLARTDSAVTVGDIEAAVATYFGITPADIHSSRRTRTVSVARMIAMFLARRHTRMSFPEIGRFMGKNHSSVVLAVQRMEKLLSDDGEITWNTPAGKRSMQAARIVALLTEQYA